MNLLDDLRADLLAYEQARPRAQQVETGASQTTDCRAAAMFRLRKEPETDPVLGWQAWVGNAIHERLDAIRKDNARYLCEQRYSWRSVPCTVDLIDTATGTLADYKTVDDAGRLPDQPKTSWLHQVNLGAMAAREAGVNVESVAVIGLPRAGSLDGARVYGPYPVDESVAAHAADLVAEQYALAESGADPREFRDQAPAWCRDWCPWVTACRGEQEPAEQLDEPAVVAAVEQYVTARSERDAALGRMDEARDALLGLSGQVGNYKITSSREKRTEKIEPDTDALIEWYRFVNGDDEAVPATTRIVKSAARLTVRQVMP